MVQFKRKPVKSLPNPIVEDHDTEVWLIDATGELFVEYEEYLKRITFYKQKKFICEITGHSGLDFFAALDSETQYSRGVEEQFPEPLKGPILRKVQFQVISRIDSLVDVVYDHFKNDFYPGEVVTFTLKNHDKTEVQIREKMSIPEQRDATGRVTKPSQASYQIILINRNNDEMIAPGENLARDRKIFTKAMLRAFLKNTLQREAWNGAPWTVKDEYAQKFSIDQAIPRHLQRGTTAAQRKAMLAYRKAQAEKGLMLLPNTFGPNDPPPWMPKEEEKTAKSHKSKAQQAVVKQKQAVLTASVNGHMKIQAKPEPVKPPPKPAAVVIKWPIDDLSIMPTVHGKTRPELKFFNQLPSNAITEDNIPLLLETWQFLNVYCEPFLLDSFTFDDYIECLEFSSEDAECELFVEIHCALLKLFVDYGDNGKVKLAGLPVLESQEDDDEEEDEEDGDAAKEEEAAPDAMDTDSVKSETKAKSRSGSPSGTKHLAGEMGADWMNRLRRRDFKNGGWQVIVVGLLHRMSTVEYYSDFCKKVLPELAPADMPPTEDTAYTQYNSLDVNLRIGVIQMLLRMTYNTSVIREYMEECQEGMTKLRKEKIEHQKTRKTLLAELQTWDEERKILLPENTPQSPGPDTTPGTPVVDEEGDTKMEGRGASYDDSVNAEDDEDGEGIVRSRSLRGGNNRVIDRKRKREQEAAKAEAQAKIPKSAGKFKKVLQNIERIKKEIKSHDDEIAIIDNDLREADCSRLRMLGRDRFWNRYWFFERNGQPFGGLPTSSTADAGYAMGRVWMQGPIAAEMVGFLDLHHKVDNITRNNHTIPMSVWDRKVKEEGNSCLTTADQWGYIDEPEVFLKLLEWLEVRGERELKLNKEMQLYKEKILEGMRARQEYLNPAEKKEGTEPGTRMSTRTKQYLDPKVYRCLRWTNTAAVEKLGHIHSEQPKKAKAATRKSTGSSGGFNAINRDGKSLSRQGGRYSF